MFRNLFKSYLTLSLLKNIATLGFIGFIPLAPGTFGSLAAMLIFLFFKPQTQTAISFLLPLIVLGTISAHYAEKLLDEKDSRHIVIDELIGYAVSVLFLPTIPVYYLAAFLLFRFFDILKPPPVKQIEGLLSGGLGIVADDVMAGIYTNILLQIWKLLTQN
ncbi:MAG TPA: phosphatidylglycerophosphatase A [Thermodesulfovibrionales bacterium]|jgi:phosphatidylglycerophosphatase A|nr:phosphatidylglycerophosphatase A [Thermodesulfovibrionales bacterium]